MADPVFGKLWSDVNKMLDGLAQQKKRPSFWLCATGITKPDEAVWISRLAESKLNIPLSLGVTAGLLQPLDAWDFRDNLDFVMYGWSHTNYEPEGKPPAEFGISAKIDQAIENIQRGMDAGDEHFATKFQRVLVPTWLRISPKVVARLPEAHCKTYCDSERQTSPIAFSLYDYVGVQGDGPVKLLRRSLELAPKLKSAPIIAVFIHPPGETSDNPAAAQFLSGFVPATRAHGMKWISAADVANAT